MHYITPASLTCLLWVHSLSDRVKRVVIRKCLLLHGSSEIVVVHTFFMQATQCIPISRMVVLGYSFSKRCCLLMPTCLVM